MACVKILVLLLVSALLSLAAPVALTSSGPAPASSSAPAHHPISPFAPSPIWPPTKRHQPTRPEQHEIEYNEQMDDIGLGGMTHETYNPAGKPDDHDTIEGLLSLDNPPPKWPVTRFDALVPQFEDMCYELCDKWFNTADTRAFTTGPEYLNYLNPGNHIPCKEGCMLEEAAKALEREANECKAPSQ